MNRVGRAIVLIAVLLVVSLSGNALAHKPSDSYLKLGVAGNIITGQWDIALRDLDFAIGLDGNQDGAITWGEVKAKHRETAAYALARLTLGPAEAPCAVVVGDHLIDNHSDGAYAVLRFTATCPTPPKVLEIGYRLFFDIDPSHRGLLNLSTEGGTSAGIFSDAEPAQDFAIADISRGAQFVDYVEEGMLHIWWGFDHILFLLSLLLPAVLVRPARAGATWSGSAHFNGAFWDVFKVVTAFTVAHSVTLSLAALDVIALPSRLVESAIALSVMLAALNNIYPMVQAGRWIIAFGFGLVHGFGFASVLADLGLPRDALLLSLIAFNLGVELGQLAIVAVFLPLAYVMRDTRFYRRLVMVGGSFVIALIAAVWLAERALNVVLVARSYDPHRLVLATGATRIQSCSGEYQEA